MFLLLPLFLPLVCVGTNNSYALKREKSKLSKPSGLSLEDNINNTALANTASAQGKLYIIVLPYLRHYSAFVPKIGVFSGKVDTQSKREILKINRFPLVVFFRRKFSRAESCAEE